MVGPVALKRLIVVLCPVNGVPGIRVGNVRSFEVAIFGDKLLGLRWSFYDLKIGSQFCEAILFKINWTLIMVLKN